MPCLIDCLLYWQFGPPPVLEHIPGRPLLTSGHLRAVQDLHPFFNAIVAHPYSTGCFAASTRAPRQPFTDVDSIDAGAMPKSKSAPEFRGMNLDVDLRSGSPYGVPDDATTPQQFFERMVETDFLEPMPKSTC